MKKLFSLDFRVWSASILNAVFLAFQLWTLLRTRNPEGLSVAMMLGFLYMQVTFMQLGYREKQWGMFWGMLASAIITMVIILLTFLFRSY